MTGCLECPGGELWEGESFREAAKREYEEKITKVIVKVYKTIITLGEVADIDYKIQWEWEKWRLYPEAQVLLTNNIDSVNEYLQKKFLLKKLPRLLVIEGADGSGKTTIIRKLKEELRQKGLKYLHNETKRRRKENETLLEFREGVTNRRNQNLIEGLIHRIKHEGGCKIVITDKSPYVEFFYQKTKWNHERLNTYESHQLMKKVFASSEVIDASLIIHLKNPEAWNNYI